MPKYLIPVVIALFDDGNGGDVQPGDVQPSDVVKRTKAVVEGELKSATFRLAAQTAIGALGPVDLEVVTCGFLALNPDIDEADIESTVSEFAKDHPAVFASAPMEANRYIVEAHTTFEYVGSTVTFRDGQIVNVGSREYAIAREHNVPMRALQPILR